MTIVLQCLSDDGVQQVLVTAPGDASLPESLINHIKEKFEVDTTVSIPTEEKFGENHPLVKEFIEWGKNNGTSLSVAEKIDDHLQAISTLIIKEIN